MTLIFLKGYDLQNLIAKIAISMFILNKTDGALDKPFPICLFIPIL